MGVLCTYVRTCLSSSASGDTIPYVILQSILRGVFAEVRMRIIESRSENEDNYMYLASIPGRVFAFITVRRTTRPGTSCLAHASNS